MESGITRFRLRQFLERKPRGRQWSLDFCCMMLPTSESEASVAKKSSALRARYWSGTAAVRRSFAFWKASSTASVRSNVFVLPFKKSPNGVIIAVFWDVFCHNQDLVITFHQIDFGKIVQLCKPFERFCMFGKGYLLWVFTRLRWR